MGQKFFDQFSLLHFASGVVAYFFGIKFATWVVLHIIFEVVENTEVAMNIITNYLTFWPGGKHSSDSFTNSVGDQVFAMFGWYVAYKLDTYYRKR